MSPIKTKSLPLLRKEKGVSQHLPITHLNSPTVFETQQGHVGSVLKIAGIPFDTQSHDVLNEAHRIWHQALMSLNDEFGVYVTIHRHEMPTDLTGSFSNSFLQQLDEKYHQRFKERAFFNDIYITFLHKGVTSGKAGKGLKAFRALSNKTIQHARNFYRQQQIKKLHEIVFQCVTTLSRFKPQLLGERDEVVGHSELLSFLSLWVNGGESLPLSYTHYFQPLAKSIQQIPLAQRKYPQGNLSHYLPFKRLYFGKAIQFESAYTLKSTFGALLSIKQYGNETASIIFDQLLHLDTSFISTHSYFVEPNTVADNLMKRHMARMENVEDPAISQREALHEARDLLASQQMSMGFHHHTLLLLSADIMTLEQMVPQAVKCYQDVGFVPIRETIGQESAFWAQIPGNQKYIARSSLITSANFANFCSLHNYRTGYRNQNHLGECVTLLETPSRTPYYFNFHAKGSQQNPSKGHTMIIGGNGAGKTALMCFLDAQTSRYQGFTACFDRDRGMEIYIRASGGGYYIISPEFKEEIQFAPLMLPDTDTHRKFNLELLALLCKNPDETYLPAELMEPLKECVDYAYEQLAKEHRTLSNATALLPMDFPRRAALNRWLKGQKGRVDGEYAYLFDNDKDTLSLHKKMGFDLTHFLDQEPNHIRTPVILYILNRLSEAMNGQLVSIYFDEGWQYLRDPFWQHKFEAWIPTLRKHNAHIVMATQSPESVTHSSINHVFLNNVATSIFFANPQAQEATYIDGLKLTASEYECIRESSPESRIFLVKQEHDSTLCRLDLSMMQDALLVLSANKESVSQLTTLRHTLGDSVEAWLPALLQWRHQK
jgi:type IV secretion system protein VirB4